MPALIYPVLLLGLLLGAGPAGGWWMVAFNLVLVPLADTAIRHHWPRWQVSPRVLRALFARPWFWCYAVAQSAVLVYALQLVSTAALTPLAFMGLVSGVGLMTGTAGITAAHELIHRRDRSDRTLGLGLLAMVSYLHFRIEHVYGHHRHVATGHDPASADIAETFPAFFMRALHRGIRSAWQIEAAQRRRRGLQVLSLRNRMVQYLGIQSLLYALILVQFGWLALALFLLQSLMAVHLLEAVNYVQHYGLRRGAGERIEECHAWDGDDPISGLLVFNLNRHAQHHRDPMRSAAELGVAERAPRLPYSFFLMVFLALLPPVWNRLMQPRLAAARRIDSATQKVAPRAGAIHA